MARGQPLLPVQPPSVLRGCGAGWQCRLPAHSPWGASIAGEKGGTAELHWLPTAFQGEDWDCGFMVLVLYDKYSVKILKVFLKAAPTDLTRLRQRKEAINKPTALSKALVLPPYSQSQNCEHLEAVSKIQPVNSHSKYLLFRSMLSFSRHLAGLL